MSPNARAALLMTLSMGGYLCNDVLMRGVAPALGIGPSITLRGILICLLFGGILWWQAPTISLSRRDRLVIGVRSAFEAALTWFFLNALLHMPLANLHAIMQFTPLALILAAVLLLGEHVGWRRYCAIAIGFIGVMIVIRPDQSGFNTFAILGFIAMLGVTARDITTRFLHHDVPTLWVSVTSAVTVTTMGAALSLNAPWVIPSIAQVLTLCGAAVFLCVGYYCSVAAVRHGDMSASAPFRYTSLIWAMGLGYWVFDEVPDQWTLLGCTLVACSGLFALYRARQQTQ